MYHVFGTLSNSEGLSYLSLFFRIHLFSGYYWTGNWTRNSSY